MDFGLLNPLPVNVQGPGLAINLSEIQNWPEWQTASSWSSFIPYFPWQACNSLARAEEDK